MLEKNKQTKIIHKGNQKNKNYKNPTSLNQNKITTKLNQKA